MADIKSTLDLVMEKTRDMKMSDEEKKALNVQETLKKIPGLVKKYLDGALKDKDFQRQVAEYSEVDAKAVKKELVKELARGLTFKERDRDLRVVDALERIKLGNVDNVVNELRKCLENFYSEQKELLEQKLNSYLKDLEKAKIRGSAIVPKVVLQQDEMSTLQAIKATCLNLISRLL